MLAQELHQTGSLWSFLLSVDKDLAECARRDGCSCGGRLHCADYPQGRSAAPIIRPMSHLLPVQLLLRSRRMQKACNTAVGAFSRQEGLPWCRRHPGQRDEAGTSTATGSRAFKPIRR